MHALPGQRVKESLRDNGFRTKDDIERAGSDIARKDAADDVSCLPQA
jgi:hypothetical protein